MASTLLPKPCLPILRPGLKLSIYLLWGRCSGTEISFRLSLHNLKVFGNVLFVKMERWLLKTEGCRGHGEQTCACPGQGELCLPSFCCRMFGKLMGSFVSLVFDATGAKIAPSIQAAQGTQRRADTFYLFPLLLSTLEAALWGRLMFIAFEPYLI